MYLQRNEQSMWWRHCQDRDDSLSEGDSSILAGLRCRSVIQLVKYVEHFRLVTYVLQFFLLNIMQVVRSGVQRSWVQTRMSENITLLILNFRDLNLSHTHTVVRECCKSDDANQRGNGKFDPMPRQTPLTDHHQKLHKWLGPGYLPTWKIWSWYLKGFLFPVCTKLRVKDVYSASFFRVLPTAHSPAPWTDFHA